MGERNDAAVGRSFLKLGAGEAAARLISFSATVYLARLLGADSYGVIVLATAILLYVACVSDCGVDLLGVHDVARDPAALARLAPAYLGARLLVAIALSVLLAGVGLLVFPRPEGPVLAGYAAVLLPLALGTRWVHLGLERSGRAALARVLSEGLAALLIVLLIHGPGDLLRAPLIQLAAESAAALLLLGLLPRGSGPPRLTFRKSVIAALFQRSWPIVAHTLLGLLIFNSDFFFLRIYRDSATVGHYAVAYTLVSFFLNLGGSYEMSLLPAITRLGRERSEQRRLYGSALAQVFTGALPVAIGGCLLAGPLVALVFGAGYAASAAPLRVLIWCIPIAVFRNVAQTGLIAHGQQAQLLRTAGWAAGLNVALNAALVPLWGMVGAALITVLTEGVRTGLALRFSWRAGLSLPSPRRLWRALVAGAVMALVIGLATIHAVWLAVLVGAAVYLLVLALVGGVRWQRGALPELTV